MTTVNIEFSDEELTMIAKASHHRGITINQFINDSLRSYIIKSQSDDIDFLKRMSKEKSEAYKRLKEQRLSSMPKK
jgi:hypothetical protein